MSVWKRHRKMINPIFNRKNLDHFVEVFAKQSTALGEYLEKYVGMHDVNLFQIVKRCNLDITCGTSQKLVSDIKYYICRFRNHVGCSDQCTRRRIRSGKMDR